MKSRKGRLPLIWEQLCLVEFWKSPACYRTQCRIIRVWIPVWIRTLHQRSPPNQTPTAPLTTTKTMTKAARRKSAAAKAASNQCVRVILRNLYWATCVIEEVIRYLIIISCKPYESLGLICRNQYHLPTVKSIVTL